MTSNREKSKGKEKVRSCVILNTIIRVDLIEKETSEQRLKGSGGNRVSHVDIWGKSVPGRES